MKQKHFSTRRPKRLRDYLKGRGKHVELALKQWLTEKLLPSKE